MSNAADETELLELPDEFRGLPYRVKAEAFASAEGELSAAVVLSSLGQSVAETLLVNAAAHYLVLQGYGHARSHSTASASGYWAGSSYGDAVARSLAKLPRQTGRTRSHPLGVE